MDVFEDEWVLTIKQTLINEALREHMQYRDETLENVLREVIREELKARV